MSEQWPAPFDCEGCGITLGVPTSWRSWWWDWFGPDDCVPDDDDSATLCYACQGHCEEPIEMTAERMPILEAFIRIGYEVFP